MSQAVLHTPNFLHSSIGGKITSCTACEDGQSIASGSSDGSVHLWRVEYVTRTGGMPDKYTGLQSMPCHGLLPCVVNPSSHLHS